MNFTVNPPICIEPEVSKQRHNKNRHFSIQFKTGSVFKMQFFLFVPVATVDVLNRVMIKYNLLLSLLRVKSTTKLLHRLYSPNHSKLS
jgi:hypothetical protein